MASLPFGKDMPLTIGEVQNEVNRLFGRLWHSGISMGPLDGQDWAPPVDLLDEEDRYVLKAEVPGLDIKDIEVSIGAEGLTLKGFKASERREGDEKKYLLAERRFGSFLRTLPLPAGIETANVRATCKKGVLEVVLPKKEESKPKAVRIDVTD